MGYKLESIKTSYINIRKVLNKIDLYNGQGYYT